MGPGGLKCQVYLKVIITWESSDVVRFDLRPLLEGQIKVTKLKSAYKSVIIAPRGLRCETNL